MSMQVAEHPNSRSIRSATTVRVMISAAFLLSVFVFMDLFPGAPSGGGATLVVAAVVGGYMALNIGANDVANNVGPTVGSGALTMAAAVGLAAVFEIAGAFVAGGDVVGTIKSGIIDPAQIGDNDTFVWLMLAALFAGALWLNVATYLGAPVSTTHSIVGGLLGAGIAAGGWQIANWDRMATIAASWVVSPVLGGGIAALILYATTRLIFQQRDLIASARRYVPVLLALMAWAFGTYLAIKGLKKVWPVDFATACLIGLGCAVAVYSLIKPVIANASGKLSNDRGGINSLFTIPLICAAALLSFAHGANDVANAIGPLAAINEALSAGAVSAKAGIPLWVMAIGAFGIATGLALFGPKLIRTVGSEITQLDKTSAFCVALGAAITVILASQLGLPVSSTHIAVGGVCGVGFLREYLTHRHARATANIEHRVQGTDQDAVAAFLKRFRSADPVDQATMVSDLSYNPKPGIFLIAKPSRHRADTPRQVLVKRRLLVKIAAAWVITVPASGILAAGSYFMIRGFMLP